MHLITEHYNDLKNQLPASGRHILAQYDDERVVVYQAYRPEIAAYAVKHQRLGGSHFKLSRMTWIKPNFLWMMHRCGWANKTGQERVLAIWLWRAAFEEILALAEHATFRPEIYADHAEWKRAIKDANVQLQWDPDYDPQDNRLERRAIQLGLRGPAAKAFAQGGWIAHIEDISAFVEEQHQRLSPGLMQWLTLPRERVYPVVDATLAERLALS